jgi:hypothetical protein
MKTKFLAVSIIVLVLSVSTVSALAIKTIKTLDSVSIFHFSIISDLGANSTTDPLSDAKNKKGIEWVRSSEFVMGGGDEIKKLGTTWETFIGSDSYFKTKFYPCIGGGENRAYGGTDTKWGSGAAMFNKIPGFWNRTNVEKCPLEPKDPSGNTPSYYASFTVKGYTVHILQLHDPDDTKFAATTMKFMENKLNELKLLKTREPGKHIIAIHAHRGALIKCLGESGATDVQIKLLISTADLVTDADMHLGRRFWTGVNFFEDACNWYPAVGQAFKDPNACVWYNTGILCGDGYLEIHVLPNPTRITVQYMSTNLGSRALVTGSTWGYAVDKDRRPLIKTIDGPTAYVDWNNVAFKSVGAILPKVNDDFNDGITVSAVGANRKVRIINSHASQISLNLFDVQGRLLARLYNSFTYPGIHSINLNTASYKSGVYYLQSSVGQKKSIQQIVIREK